MRKIGLYLVILMSTILMGCSIDKDPMLEGLAGKDGTDGQDGSIPTFDTFEMDNGTMVIIFIDNNLNGEYDKEDVLLSDFLVENGRDGQDGSNGTDGRSPLISQTKNENDTFIQIYFDNNNNGVLDEGDEILEEFTIEDGTDGNSGEDGTDGSDGEDGLSPSIKYLEVENGTVIYIYFDIDNDGDYTEGDTLLEEIFIQNGTDGIDGRTPIIDSYPYGCGKKILYGFDTDNDGDLRFETDEILGYEVVCDGEDGSDGEDGQDAQGDTVTICHKQGNTYTSLTLTFSEYIHHIYEEHNGNSTQNDSFGECPSFSPMEICKKEWKCSHIFIDHGNNQCNNGYWKYNTITVTTQEDYDYWFDEYKYKHGTSEGACN